MPSRSKSKKEMRKRVPKAVVVEEEDPTISEEDMEFVREHDVSFLDRLSRLDEVGKSQSDRKKNNESKKEVEESYERVSRKNKEWESEEEKIPLQGGLPVKMLDGQLRFDTEKALRELEKTTEEVEKETTIRQAGGSTLKVTFHATSKKEGHDQKRSGDAGMGIPKVEKVPVKKPSPQVDLKGKLEINLKEEEDKEELRKLILDKKFRDSRRAKLRETIAVLSSKILENPEERIGDVETIFSLTGDVDKHIQSVAEISLYAVFKDICPGYRIRLPTEKELAVEVSKEVKRVREYESMLLKHYSMFLKHAIQKGRKVENEAVNTMQTCSQKDLSAKITIIRLLGGLLEALPDFNFRTDILRAMLPWVTSANETISAYCSGVLESIIRADRQGQLSLEVVQLTAELVKKRNCNASPRLLHPFLFLHMSEIPVLRAEEDLEANPWKKGKKALRKERKMKAKQNNAQRKEDDLGFEEARAEADPLERGRSQSLALEAVFECFFRVVKDAGGEEGGVKGRWGQRPLLMVALRGIEKFAHLISIEILVDLIQVLLGLIKKQSLKFGESLCVLLTACAVLKGRGEALIIDSSSLYECMFRVIADAPLESNIDMGSMLGEIPQVSGRGKVVLEDLFASLLQKGICDAPRALDLQKAAAFAKRLSSVALHLPQGNTAACLATVRRILYRYSKVRCLLDSEVATIAGQYDWECDVPDQCGALGSTLWELSLLTKHFNPQIQKIAGQVSLMDDVNGLSASSNAAMSNPLDACKQFSTARGDFYPVIQMTDDSSNKRKKIRPLDDNLTLLGTPDDPAVGIEDKFKSAFREARAYRIHGRLRREVSLLRKKVSIFQDHLNAKKTLDGTRKRKASSGSGRTTRHCTG